MIYTHYGEPVEVREVVDGDFVRVHSLDHHCDPAARGFFVERATLRADGGEAEVEAALAACRRKATP